MRALRARVDHGRCRAKASTLTAALLAVMVALVWSIVTAAGSASAAPGDESTGPGKGSTTAPSRPGGSEPTDRSGGEPPPGVSVPRVLLTAFSAKPATVAAGAKVTLSYTLKNMSNRTLVQNLRITVTSDDAGAFLPVGGAASSHIAAIYAGSTITRTIEMQTLPSLEQRPYALTLRIEYEDSRANPYQVTEQVAIPVTQAVRVDTSSPQVLPATVAVGQQAAVTFSVNNLGRNKLFNVQATIPGGQSVAAQKAFIGTIEPGAAGFVDLTVLATKASAGPFTMEISYEDANGTVTATKVPIALTVSAEPSGPARPPISPQEVSPPGGGGIGVIPVLAGVLAVGLLATLVVLIVQRQRRRAKQRESELALLDADPLLPADEG